MESKKDGKNPTTDKVADAELKSQLKAQRKAAFEAKRAEGLKESTTEQKSKSDMKKERRALQEAQRAAKSSQPIQKSSNINDTAKNVQQKTQPNVTVVKNPELVVGKSLGKDVRIEKQGKEMKENVESVPTKAKQKPLTRMTSKSIELFNHIPQRPLQLDSLTMKIGVNGGIDPTVLKIGLKMNKGLIRGSNMRCAALLIGLKHLIQLYETPSHKELVRDLETKLDANFKFLEQCRPLSVSMRSAMTHLKLHLSKISPNTSDAESKKYLCNVIDSFILEDIKVAQNSIVELAISKIDDKGDVILTYGYSLIVKHIFYAALNKQKQFRVIVVDSRPQLNGQEMVKFLVKHNIQVTYVYINAVFYVMKEVTKVLLGSHALLANGYMMGKMGSSQIALVAQACNVPVLICCETYRFSERVHTDSFVYNEAGDTSDLLQGKKRPNLNSLNLLYDVTPADFITMIITDKGLLPCSSVPAVIRTNISKNQ